MVTILCLINEKVGLETHVDKLLRNQDNQGPDNQDWAVSEKPHLCCINHKNDTLTGG